MFYKVVIYTLICKTLIAESLPQETLSMHNAIDSFQNAVQQQTFHSVLLAIEERLRNLDNIYSMQLSETLKSKLDQYHRKLESLDIKIIRLESLVMLNLNKISENISTKNYKDDIAITQAYRKLDNIYDGLTHRINYMERKSDMSFDKLQNKIETTLVRIEKMEENMMQRNSDIETELSETLFVMEDLKSSSANTEQSLLKINGILNQTVSNAPLMNSINLSTQNLIKDLKQSFTERLEKLENTSLTNLNVSKENNDILKSMKLELKKDFNEYANKVADMNMDIWKRNDIAEENLKTIETAVNSTRIEVQNGVRALMLQTGKLSGKVIINNDKTSLESLRKSVNLSLEKIITNQELFLESCHRVQMDESQIETEISVMLGKLIDMLEKKMTTVMKDLKSLEKIVKNHDSRTTRNIYQANTNIVLLFEKTTKSSESTEKELQEIKFYINSLFTFIQDVLPKSTVINGVNQNTEVLLNNLSVNISNFIKSTNVVSDIRWIQFQLERNFAQNNEISRKIYDQITNISEKILNIEFISQKNLSNKIDSFLQEMKNIIVDGNKTFAKIHDDYFNTTNSVSTISFSKTINRRNCTRNYSDLIELRADDVNCNEDMETVSVNNNQDIKTPSHNIHIETYGIYNNENTELKQSSTQKPQDDEQLKQAILEIFGTPSSVINASTKNTLNKIRIKASKNKKECIPAWVNALNIRVDPNRSSEVFSECSTNEKKTKGGKRIKSQLNVDTNLEYEDSAEDIDSFSENLATTESSTDIGSIFPTEITVTENL